MRSLRVLSDSFNYGGMVVAGEKERPKAAAGCRGIPLEVEKLPRGAHSDWLFH